MKESAQSTKITVDLSSLSPQWERPASQLAILPRQPEPGWQEYFQALMPTPIHLAATIQSNAARESLYGLLMQQLPAAIQQHPFTPLWIEDMAAVCQAFSTFLNQSTVCFWLRSTRVCSKFHVDKTPYRLLLTYFGPGTEWTLSPLSTVDMHSSIQRIAPWHVAILQGGAQGIVHRSPPQHKSSYSILMRLDHPDFLSR